VVTTSLRDAVLGREPAQARQVRAAADEQQRRAGHPPAQLRQRAHEHVLALARHQARHAHDDRSPVSRAAAAPRSPPAPGRKTDVSTPLGSCSSRAPRPRAGASRRRV
jgi:hypothetical protein